MKQFMNLFSGVILVKRGDRVEGNMSVRHTVTYSLAKQFHVGNNTLSWYSGGVSFESGPGHNLFREVPRAFLQSVQANPCIVTPRLIHDRFHPNTLQFDCRKCTSL